MRLKFATGWVENSKMCDLAYFLPLEELKDPYPQQRWAVQYQSACISLKKQKTPKKSQVSFAVPTEQEMEASLAEAINSVLPSAALQIKYAGPGSVISTARSRKFPWGGILNNIYSTVTPS